MKFNGSPHIASCSAMRALFILSVFLCSSHSNAQAQVNFSGTWIQDTVKSDDFYKAFGLTYEITQTPQAYTVKQIFTIKGRDEAVIRNYSFTLDGKVKNVETENGTEKNTANWSADKKTLTTRSVIAYGGQDVGFTETYSLSKDGLVLTAQKSDIIPGAFSVKIVLNKKQ